MPECPDLSTTALNWNHWLLQFPAINILVNSSCSGNNPYKCLCRLLKWYFGPSAPIWRRGLRHFALHSFFFCNCWASRVYWLPCLVQNLILCSRTTVCRRYCTGPGMLKRSTFPRWGQNQWWWFLDACTERGNRKMTYSWLDWKLRTAAVSRITPHLLHPVFTICRVYQRWEEILSYMETTVLHQAFSSATHSKWFTWNALVLKLELWYLSDLFLCNHHLSYDQVCASVVNEMAYLTSLYRNYIIT